MLTCLWFRITRQAFTVEMFINQTFVTLFKIKTGTVNIVDRLAITTRCDVVAALWQAITSVVAVTPELIGNLEPQDEHLQVAEFALLQWWWNNVAIDAQPAANGFFQLVDIIALIKINFKISTSIKCTLPAQSCNTDEKSSIFSSPLKLYTLNSLSCTWPRLPL